MEGVDFLITLKFTVVAVLAAFLPLIAFSFLFYRRKQRQFEIERILEKLGINNTEHQQLYHSEIKPWHFVISASFVTLISLIGLGTLLLGDELGLARSPTLVLGGIYLPDKDHKTVSVPSNGSQTKKLAAANNGSTSRRLLDDSELLDYQESALLAYGMAFLGAYLWGLQYVFRRFVMNDLAPSAFYGLGIRMIFSAMIALLTYHSVAPFPPETIMESDSASEFSLIKFFPALAFLIGMFPQRGLKWLSERTKVLAESQDSSVRPLPLVMIEGISLYDKMRLEELGIDSCYNLANADFIPLLLKTPYGARELIDWLLQAKLCVRFGPDVKVLRAFGIRTIVDLQRLNEEELKELAKSTPLTEFSLNQAAACVDDKNNILRLWRAGQLLSRYWESGDANSDDGSDNPR